MKKLILISCLALSACASKSPVELTETVVNEVPTPAPVDIDPTPVPVMIHLAMKSTDYLTLNLCESGGVTVFTEKDLDTFTKIKSDNMKLQVVTMLNKQGFYVKKQPSLDLAKSDFPLISELSFYQGKTKKQYTLTVKVDDCDPNQVPKVVYLDLK